MLHKTLKYIGDRLDTPMRMPGKPGQVLVGVGGMEVIQHQEGVD